MTMRSPVGLLSGRAWSRLVLVGCPHEAACRTSYPFKLLAAEPAAGTGRWSDRSEAQFILRCRVKRCVTTAAVVLSVRCRAVVCPRSRDAAFCLVSRVWCLSPDVYSCTPALASTPAKFSQYMFRQWSAVQPFQFSDETWLTVVAGYVQWKYSVLLAGSSLCSINGCHGMMVRLSVSTQFLQRSLVGNVPYFCRTAPAVWMFSCGVTAPESQLFSITTAAKSCS